MVSLGPCSDVRIISSAARDSRMARRTPTLGLEKLMGVNSAAGQDEGGGGEPEQDVSAALRAPLVSHSILFAAPGRDPDIPLLTSDTGAAGDAPGG